MKHGKWSFTCSPRIRDFLDNRASFVKDSCGHRNTKRCPAAVSSSFSSDGPPEVQKLVTIPLDHFLQFNLPPIMTVLFLFY